MSALKIGPGLYEFLVEAELQQYFSGLKNDLKVSSVGQIKYVTDDDLHQIGMAKPEMRRLRKFFHKHCPQNYLSKFKKMIATARKEDGVLRGLAAALPDANSREKRPPVKVPSKHIIPAEAIVINKELGTGEFGVVQQGVWTNEDGERIQVAIKCLSRERMQSNPIEFLKEAAIMHTIDHEHVVRLYGVVLDTSSLMLVTELAPLRSLLECLKEPSLRTSFPVMSLCDFAHQICDGMAYLEASRLIHRDLAARNILVFSKHRVKISDFGLSRALGVGKDYYQTNFNVNLKLPIAWCAPECINYLRFTSASDIWAYGVTLWEAFSYGFQPWAALTGHQILEAIDEPSFQRLEQPDCCPKEHYSLMLKCWQHDPAKRPRFADLLLLLPECKPEQVQAIRDSPEELAKMKRDHLTFRVGDIITVLDKKPVTDLQGLWKGVLNNGKTGLFPPGYTVSYLGTSLPSLNKPPPTPFQRGDGKNAYSSKRRLRPDMISCPQGDLKHTGHVGLDGAYFGDVSFLGDKLQLPKQVVAPYQPQADEDGGNGLVPPSPSSLAPPGAPLTRTSSDGSSDRAPLLLPASAIDDGRGKSGPASDQLWLDSVTEGKSGTKSDHEYHEISDEEDCFDGHGVESPRFEKTFDYGPSLMDEVFRALESSDSVMNTSAPSSPPASEIPDEAHNVRNELREMAARVVGGTLSKDGTTRKKTAAVKPISASDERTLDSAIAMANELATRSMLDLDGKPPKDRDGLPSHSTHSGDISPRTPSSPNKRRFSFRFPVPISGKTGNNSASVAAGNSSPSFCGGNSHSSNITNGSREVCSSPKHERRNFTDEAASIVDIQSSLSDEAKEAYNSLIEKPPDLVDTNPLRMLRSGGAMRARVRGNKHHLHNSQQANGLGTLERVPPPAPRNNVFINQATSSQPLYQRSTLDRSKLGPPPPVSPKPRFVRPPPLQLTDIASEDIDSPNVFSPTSDNPLPLPPRDRTRLTSASKPRHQRKHPLIIPGEGIDDIDSVDSIQSPYDFHVHATDDIQKHMTAVGNMTAASGPVSLDDSFESQIASELDALDDITVEDLTCSPPTHHTFSSNVLPPASPPPLPPGPPSSSSPSSTMYKSDDHVSCEDLLEFACDRPNAKRTQGPARGADSDEVRIMQKVLGKEKVSPDTCVDALNGCEWDVHRAIKFVKLSTLLKSTNHPFATCTDATRHEALEQCGWDVARAASFLIANGEDDTTEV